MAEDSRKEQDDWERRQKILNRIESLNDRLVVLNEKLKKIEEAMKRVQSASSSEKLSKSANSFRWIVDNMDTYWSATESVARDTVKDTLTKVSNECGSSGKIMSQVGPVMSAANEKINEIKLEIDDVSSEIARLNNSLMQERV